MEVSQSATPANDYVLEMTTSYLLTEGASNIYGKVLTALPPFNMG
jgi:hypothetical protein